MNLRRLFSRIAPEIDRAPSGIPTWIVEADWQVRERLFVERITRYLRLASWLMVLSITILICSMMASVASIEFGLASPAGTGGKELFSRGSADAVHNPPDIAP